MDKDSTSRIIDVSHIVEEGQITYEGLPAPIIYDFLSRADSRAHYAPGTEFHIGKIDMVANTGTYVDAPFHRFSNGKDLADLPLGSLADLPGQVIRAPFTGSRIIDEYTLADVDLTGKAVLFDTGWSQHWQTDQYFEGHPYLTQSAAEALAAGGATLVGIDSLNIDNTADGRRPVHTILLEHGIPIAEHLTGLDRLPEDGFRFHAVPVKVRQLGSFPVRAYAVLDM
jgi:kynurenine formamidase